MEKSKYHFGYKDKIYWVWLWKKEFDLLGFTNNQELNDEEFERLKPFLK